MDPTIVTREETILVGLASEEGNMHKLWQDFDLHDKQIKHKTSTYLEVHTFPDDQKSGKATEYFVGAEVTGLEEVAEGLVVKHLPAGTYAVFTHRLAEGGYTGCNERMENWLKTGPYQLSPNLSVQVFDARFKGNDNPESVIDFLLPVKEK